MPLAHPTTTPPVRQHSRDLPLRVGTRGSPLALWQTRFFLQRLSNFCPVLRQPLVGDRPVFEEHAIATTGDAVLDRPLADIGGKGLFAKEIHEALADGRIDFAVHSLKDLETTLPDGIVLACTMTREDAREITHNVVGFFSILREWAEEERRAAALAEPSPPPPQFSDAEANEK